MDFVDDEDLVAIAHRRDAEWLDDHLADGIDACVGGAVDLEDVNIAPFGDLRAGITSATGIAGGAADTVERARHDARRRRLADPARAGKDEGLREASGRNRVLQSV